MMFYGYIRVSTKEQNPDRQIAAMREAGVADACMVIEKQSGKDFERPEYQKILRKLRAGDVLYIKSIDRLGRNYAEILEQWRTITKEKGADIVVLDMPLLDTRRGRDLTGTLIADIVLQLLSYVAETERAFIRQRQREGIDAAKKKGVRFGRKQAWKPQNWPGICDGYKAGKLRAAEIADALEVSRSTVYRWIKEEQRRRYGEN